MMMLHGSFILTGKFKMNSLFNIVLDEKLLQGADKVFYHDRLSEEIDGEWVKEQLAMLKQEQYQIQHQLQQQQYEHE